jgi:hypothetical protein
MRMKVTLLFVFLVLVYPVFTQDSPDISMKNRADVICRSILSDPGGKSLLLGYNETRIPQGTRLVEISMSDPQTISITLQFPKSKLKTGDFSEYDLFRIGEQFASALDALNIHNVFLYWIDPETGHKFGFDELAPIEKGAPPVQDEAIDIIPHPQPQVKIKESPLPNPGNIQGALSGKTIYLNQGHGWFDDIDFGRWRVQRGVVSNYGILEDFSNPETINLFTMPYLVNAGATVLTMREMDHQKNMIVIDNADGSANPSNGTYAETGAWSDSTLRGFKQKSAVSWVGVSVNPFDSGGTNRLANINTAGPTATAKWTPNIPQDGYYWVYASWSRYSARSPQAQYIVHHTGGDTAIYVDQTKFGFIWFPLGRFYFKAGMDSNHGSVELTNHASTGTNVSADAVRFGGGMGDMERHTHGVSGRPRFEEEAVDYLQWNGFGSSGYLYTGDDDEAGGWSDRPQFAKWLSAYDTGDSAYMAHHTNAGGGTGTRTYLHEDATQACIDLRNAIHDEVVSDVRAGWDASWIAYKNSGNYSENNPANLGTVPGFLMETLFHDNATDCEYYRNPRFRMILGRAFAQGFIKYFAAQNGVPIHLPPETPTNFWVKNIGSGQVSLGWDAPPFNTGNGLLGDAATGYKVFISTNGYGFNDGQTVAGTNATIGSLSPGGLYFFRVCAANAGGQSFPSETLAVRLPQEGSAQALLVNGFDRNDLYLPPWETVTNAGTVIRMESEAYQTYDYTVQHAWAMYNAGVSFDGASNESVVDGDIDIASYQGLFWICGEESTIDETFSSAEQTNISQFLSTNSHCFFASGAEILWDIDSKGSTDDKNFALNTLRSAYAGDDAGTWQVQGIAAPFAGLSAFSFSPADGAPYDAQYLDQLNTSNGSTAVMGYVGGSGGNAATCYDGDVKVIVLGFPFETIASSSVRNDIMIRVAGFFNFTTITTPTPTPSPTSTPSPTPTPTPDPNAQYLVINFEEYNSGDLVMFREPHWSGSTTGIVAETDSSAVSTAETNDILDPAVGTPGLKSYRFYWEWSVAGAGNVRATTYATPVRGNPLLDLTKGLSIYIKVKQGIVDLGYWIRETGGSGPIGADGGLTGTIEKMENFRRFSASPQWQYVYFDIPNETYTTLNGDGILNDQWGTLESLQFYAVSGSADTQIGVFVDDIYQGPEHNPITPTPTPSPSPTQTSTPGVQDLVDYLVGRGGFGQDVNDDDIIDAADLIAVIME